MSDRTAAERATKNREFSDDISDILKEKADVFMRDESNTRWEFFDGSSIVINKRGQWSYGIHAERLERAEELEDKFSGPAWCAWVNRTREYASGWHKDWGYSLLEDGLFGRG